MAFRPQDGPIFCRDGEPASLADGTQFLCILEYPEDVDMFGGQSKFGAIVPKPSITYATAAPGRALKNGDAIAVDGQNYTVLTARKRGDGTMSIAELRLVES